MHSRCRRNPGLASNTQDSCAQLAPDALSVPLFIMLSTAPASQHIAKSLLTCRDGTPLQLPHKIRAKPTMELQLQANTMAVRHFVADRGPCQSQRSIGCCSCIAVSANLQKQQQKQLQLQPNSNPRLAFKPTAHLHQNTVCNRLSGNRLSCVRRQSCCPQAPIFPQQRC